jgi:hypothetical protein
MKIKSTQRKEERYTSNKIINEFKAVSGRLEPS